ncbi:MAG TPA: hypothetical protein VN240_06900 [Propylenella sp.]|nr:hypothetical protein [Propylenella sp.]
MRQFLICALFPLMAVAAPAAAQEEDTAQEDTAQDDEEILETVPVDEGGTESAPPPDEDLDADVFYSGFGLSRASSDFENLKDAINLEVVLGFRIPTVPWVGLEIDLGQTIIPGENEGSSSTGLGGGGGDNCGGLLQPPCPEGQQTETFDPDEFAMQALGASLVLKSTGRFYVLGRLGYRYVATNTEELNENRSGTGFGGGVGYRWGTGQSGVQLQYQQLSEDIDAIGLIFFARTGF